MAIATLTADGLVHRGACVVKSINAFAGATGGAFQLNDSVDDTGADLYSDTVAASTRNAPVEFDKGLQFYTGLYLDIPGTNVTVNVEYEPTPF